MHTDKFWALSWYNHDIWIKCIMIINIYTFQKKNFTRWFPNIFLIKTKIKRIAIILTKWEYSSEYREKSGHSWSFGYIWNHSRHGLWSRRSWVRIPSPTPQLRSLYEFSCRDLFIFFLFNGFKLKNNIFCWTS